MLSMPSGRDVAPSGIGSKTKRPRIGGGFDDDFQLVVC